MSLASAQPASVVRYNLTNMISSNNLYHFTCKLCYLKSILKNGIRVSYCLEDFSWLKRNNYSEFILGSDQNEDGEDLKFGVPMTCFCDIPSNLVESHGKVYGKYGIGFKKKWGKDKGINPLLYLVEQSNPSTYLRGLETLTQQIPGDQPEYRIRNLIANLFSYTKPYEGIFIKDEYKNMNHRFYDEREWRYLPASICYPVIDMAEFKSLNDRCINHITFKPKEVEIIVVDTSSEKEELQNEFHDYQSKIETIEEFTSKAK